MAESLSARVGRVIAGGVNALLDKLEDQAPAAVMEQSLRDLDEVADEVRAELGTLSANRHLAQSQHQSLNAQHAAIAAQIEEAIAAARDDLARAGVARQLDIEAQLPVLENSLVDLTTREAELKRYLEALLAKRRELQDALQRFQDSRARGDSGTPAAPGSGGGTRESQIRNATESFDRVYARHTGISPGAQGAQLEQAAKLREMEELVRNNRIEERLARLKSGQGGQA